MTGADLIARIEDWMVANDGGWREGVLWVVEAEFGLDFPAAQIERKGLAALELKLGELAPPGWKVNNPRWPAGEGECLIPEGAEPTNSPSLPDKIAHGIIVRGGEAVRILVLPDAGDDLQPFPGADVYAEAVRRYNEPALAETPPGSRIGQFLDLRAPMEREPGFLRHRENGTGDACLFCDERVADAPLFRGAWVTERCPATADQLDCKIDAVRALIAACPGATRVAAALEILLTRLRNRRDALVFAAVPEPQTCAGEDLRVSHYPED